MGEKFGATLNPENRPKYGPAPKSAGLLGLSA
jgi:hypothetical protein